MKRLVALKILSPAVTKSPEAVRRFQREVEAAAKLTHPNIVTAFDADEVNQTHFLVMEYVEGIDLSALVKAQGSLPVKQTLTFLIQAARGLDYAHTHGVVHRDMKPANLLLDRQGTVKVLDMGLARLASAGPDQDQLTGTGQIMGTVDYMAPEQALDTKAADARADIYSLGITLWYLLTGRPLYEGDSMMAKLLAHREQPIPSLVAACPAASPKLNAVFSKMVAKTPAARYQTMAEVISELELCLGEPSFATAVTTNWSKGSPSGEPLASGQPAESAGFTLQIAPPKKGVSPAEISPTISLLAGTVDTNPQLQQSLEQELAQVSAKAGQFSIPWWQSRNRLIAASSGVLVVLVLAAIAFWNFNKPEIVSTSKNPPGESAKKGRWQDWPEDAPVPARAPFTMERARQHQAEWAAYLKVPVEYSNTIGMKFVLIPPGEFMMGSSPAELVDILNFIGDNQEWRGAIQSETPLHKVVLTKPMYLGKYEVTQAEYEQIQGKNPAYFSATGKGKSFVADFDTENHPVELVNWNDATEFAAKLSAQENLQPFSLGDSNKDAPASLGTGYRLPTEAQWEFACRAGTTTKFWAGDRDDQLPQIGWFRTNCGGHTHAVGELQSNPFGLYDTNGNVWEWVQDGWEAGSYQPYRDQTAVDSVSPPLAHNQPVIRGGDWFTAVAFSCRSADRHGVSPSLRGIGIGFRLALPVEAVTAALANPLPPKAKKSWRGWPEDAPAPAISPFDKAQAKQHQAEWAAYLQVPPEYTNTLGMKFCLIPPGEFIMGSNPAEIQAALKILGNDALWRASIQSEGPQHKVILTQPIYLGAHEVTQAVYTKLMGQNPSHFSATGAGKDVVAEKETGTYPVETVSWHDSAEFCAKLSQAESLKPFYLRADETVLPLSGNGYRLPTEAEWEFSARAGTVTPFLSGEKEEKLGEIAWYQKNSGGQSHSVGELKANAWGLYDTHGNVWEWVQDRWEPTYFAQFQGKAAALNPTGSTIGETWNVTRGGGQQDVPAHLRISYRGGTPPSDKQLYIGFRVALTVEAVKTATAAEKSPVPDAASP